MHVCVRRAACACARGATSSGSSSPNLARSFSFSSDLCRAKRLERRATKVSMRWRASLAHEKLTKEYCSADVSEAAAPSPRTSMAKPLEEAILPERLKMDVTAE